MCKKPSPSCHHTLCASPILHFEILVSSPCSEGMVGLCTCTHNVQKGNVYIQLFVVVCMKSIVYQHIVTNSCIKSLLNIQIVGILLNQASCVNFVNNLVS